MKSTMVIIGSVIGLFVVGAILTAVVIQEDVVSPIQRAFLVNKIDNGPGRPPVTRFLTIKTKWTISDSGALKRVGYGPFLIPVNTDYTFCKPYQAADETSDTYTLVYTDVNIVCENAIAF